MTASAASTQTACTLDSRPSDATCEALELTESLPQGWHASALLSHSDFLFLMLQMIGHPMHC